MNDTWFVWKIVFCIDVLLTSAYDEWLYAVMQYSSYWEWLLLVHFTMNAFESRVFVDVESFCNTTLHKYFR